MVSLASRVVHNTNEYVLQVVGCYIATIIANFFTFMQFAKHSVNLHDKFKNFNGETQKHFSDSSVVDHIENAIQ